MQHRAALIANPQSGHGRGGRLIGQVAAALQRGGLRPQVLATERPGHARELAAQVVDAGCRLVIALGGDGTLNEVVSGVLARGPVPDDLVLAPVPTGTGNSFARDFGLSPRQPVESVRRILSGQTRPIDAARICYRAGGVEQTAYFVNVFGIGFMAEVADATNKRFKFLGGLSYSVAVFWRLLALRAPMTRLELWDPPGTVIREAPITAVAVCNSQWTGDGMWIAPQADPSDGQLDVLILGPVSRLELVRLFLRIFSGTHIGQPGVTVTRATRVAIAPSSPSPLLADGEVFGSTPVTVEVLPAALRMAV